jgi:hypothetical protein
VKRFKRGIYHRGTEEKGRVRRGKKERRKERKGARLGRRPLQRLEKMGRDEELRQERQALRLLCSNLIRATTRMELCNLLDSSLFQDTLHRVAFEEIRTAGTVPAKRLREELPGRITNRGFPDFELLEFLGKDLASEDEIEELFMSVLRLIQERHESDGSELEN